MLYNPQVAGKILKHISHQPAQVSPDQAVISQLRDPEREVLRLLATGLSNAEIAQALFLTDGTVKNYVVQFFQSRMLLTVPRQPFWPSVPDWSGCKKASSQ